jgi:16S rRNA (adenine1518-N6/adenine1519-N6)-dimethyltransferase
MKILEKNIPPANFFPSPEVTSSIIEVRPRKNETPVDKKMLKRIVKSSFTHKRKNILNNLKRDHFSEKTVQLFLNNRFNDIHIRAENLSVEQFVDLCREIEKT